MNTYKALYRHRETTVQAETSYAAQQLAAKLFNAKKSYEVTVMLCERDGMPIIHTAVD